jgi:hypothetical protein
MAEIGEIRQDQKHFHALRLDGIVDFLAEPFLSFGGEGLDLTKASAQTLCRFFNQTGMGIESAGERRAGEFFRGGWSKLTTLGQI